MKKEIIYRRRKIFEDLNPKLLTYNSNGYSIKYHSLVFYDENEVEEDLNEALDLFYGFKELKNNELSSNEINSTFQLSEIINDFIERNVSSWEKFI